MKRGLDLAFGPAAKDQRGYTSVIFPCVSRDRVPAAAGPCRYGREVCHQRFYGGDVGVVLA